MPKSFQIGAVRFAVGAAGATIALGLAVLVGWEFDIAVLKTLRPGLASMKANTALAFVVAGGALLVPRYALLLGPAVALFGAATLLQDLLGFDLGIDQMLAADEGTKAGAPGRMSPATALAFVLAGSAATLLFGAPGRESGGQSIALGVLVIAVMALLGYWYDAQSLYGMWAYASMSVHTALGFLILAMGLLAARPDKGWMSGVTAPGPGGRMLRRVLLPALAGLFVIGWLRVLGRQAGLYGTGFGIAVVVVGAALLFATLAWRFARELDTSARILAQTEARRRRHEALIEGQRRCLKMVAEGAPLAETHAELARIVEAQAPGMLCSILLVEDGAHVRHSAAPSLPVDFVRAIDGRRVGPAAGSCGTAAFTGRPVVVEDIATDPLWAEYREYALPHGLRSCWSTPVFDDQGTVVGTFALYYREARAPAAEHQQLVDIATQTVAISLQRQRTEATLRDSASRLHRLARRLLQAEEDSRRALSRELHDRVGQNLSALNLNLQLIRGQLASGATPGAAQALSSRIADAQQLLSETTREVRDVMVELRPPGLDDYGFATALRNYVERIAERFPARVSVFADDFQPRLPLATELALFRIAQEALTNAAKHASARRIEVRLERSAGVVRLVVADDGVGLATGPLAEASWGLATMRERAEAVGARLTIDSPPGAGVRVTVELAA